MQHSIPTKNYLVKLKKYKNFTNLQNKIEERLLMEIMRKLNDDVERFDSNTVIKFKNGNRY